MAGLLQKHSYIGNYFKANFSWIKKRNRIFYYSSLLQFFNSLMNCSGRNTDVFGDMRQRSLALSISVNDLFVDRIQMVIGVSCVFHLLYKF